MTNLPRRLCHCLIVATVAILCGPGYGQAPDAKPKATGSISGRLTIGGKAAPGIAVAAYGGETFNRRAAAQAITDGEGRYHLLGLGAGTYQVSTLAPALASAEPISPSSFGPSSGKGIVLAPAENVEDIDLKLVRGGVITGRIKDADGKPVVEQRITLTQVAENGTPIRGQIPMMAFNYQMYQTDDRGIYRIYGLPAGRYKVSVGNDPARGTMSTGSHTYFPLTFFGDVSDAAKATIVELSEGSEAGNIDIQVGHQAETYNASGRIVDSASGQPISGIRYMYGLAPKNQPYFSGFAIGVATNARGEFHIEGLAPGRYGVSISSDFDAVGMYSDPAFFEITDGDVSNIEVKATQGLSLSGVVVTDAITNREMLAQLSAMRISARVSSPSNPQTSGSGSSFIAGDGSFSINGLRPGRVGLYISPMGNQGLRGLTIARIEREGMDVTRTLELKTDQPVVNLRVVLSYGTGTIRGVVKFENGEPPPGTRLLINARREGFPNSAYGAQADVRGHFLISNLPGGTYEVGFNLGLMGPPQPGQKRAPPQKQFVTVADDAEAEITFTIDLKPAEGGP